MNAIQTTNLTKYYGKSRGIIDVNMTVKQGEFFGFIGPNGAGKSTTIRTLLGLISPTSGEGKIFERDMITAKTEILNEVGYLPSEAVFYSGMKVKDVLKLSASFRKKNCNENATRLCERLQLDVLKKVDELSFGNRKKVAIICALQHHPKLLILDEPTSGLDPLMQREFFSILEEENKAGTTVFLSSHILSEIEHYCTRAAIIKEGRMIACDRVDALSKTSTKRVTVHGDVDFESLSGIRDMKKVEGSTNFLYNGDINELVRYLAQNSIQDLSVTEPDLEEIFMHYYTDGGEM